jgi:hypothetical protein
MVPMMPELKAWMKETIQMLPLPRRGTLLAMTVREFLCLWS